MAQTSLVQDFIVLHVVKEQGNERVAFQSGSREQEMKGGENPLKKRVPEWAGFPSVNRGRGDTKRTCPRAREVPSRGSTAVPPTEPSARIGAFYCWAVPQEDHRAQWLLST